jgi:hypothetical protein
MDLRSDYIFGKDVFVKVVSIDRETLERLRNALKSGDYVPFITVEFLITNLISRERPDLISPGSRVLMSERNIDIEYFQESEYQNIIREFKDLDLSKDIKTAIIISDKLDGNLEKFIRDVSNRSEIENALIHICWLYFEYQKLFKCTHGDPKPANYTWRKLDTEIEIEYDFRDDFDRSDKRLIKRKVRNLFYLTDLEFAHSPFILEREGKKYNFTKIYEFIDDKRKDIILKPKLSSAPYYDYNTHLYGGYEDRVFGIFPRIFAIDLLTLVKVFLTYDYSLYFPSNLLRKLNLHFTRYVSLNNSFLKCSPAAFAILLNS